MFFSSPSWRWLAAVLAACAVLGVDLRQRASAPAAPSAAWPAVAAALDTAALQHSGGGAVPMPAGAAAAHASTLLVMPASSPSVLTMFWFSGERESGPNVQIAASQFDRKAQQWSAPRYVVNRHSMGALLGVGLRRLGNPVAWMDARGRVNLFVVATGWGGWAASRILHLRQSSASNSLQELSFAPVRVLPLSWLWNTSFLVRNAPLPLIDGGMVLPVHFELGSKYPAALRFDKDGDFKGMVRVSRRSYLLQPTVLMQSPREWLALMRDERPSGKIGVARTMDAGQHWSDLPDLTLDNPDSAVFGFGITPGHMLLAHNPSLGTRAVLDLSRSHDGIHWTLLKNLERGTSEDEFSYPAMVWADGSLWISYTVGRERIAWQRFAPKAVPVGRRP